MTLTLETVQNLADQLPTFEQAQLVEHLSRKLVLVTMPQPYKPVSDSVFPHPSESTSDSAKDFLVRFSAICQEIRVTYPNSDPVARLEADRRERDESLRGNPEEINVYH